MRGEKQPSVSPATHPITYSRDLPARHIGAIVVQILWESPTTFWLNLRLTP